jgi:PAS domain S-box-containing protein
MQHLAGDPFWQGSHSQQAESRAVTTDTGALCAGALVFIGYYLGAKVGLALTFQPHPISVFWPPNSILLAALLLTPPRIWWFLLLAAFPAHLIAELQSQVPPTMVACWFISNCSEAVIGAGLTRYILRGPLRFDSVRGVVVFCTCAAFLGPFLSSFIDAGFVALNGWGQSSYLENWRARFFSNALSTLTLTPAIVTWPDIKLAQWRGISNRRGLETSLLFLGLVIAGTVVLYNAEKNPDPVLFYAPLPFLLWAVFRFGARVTSAAILIVTFLAIWSSAHGHGPFAGESAEINARSIQMFLIVIAVPIMLLAAGIQERRIAESELRESESRFRIVADAAPVLIWMSGVDKLCTFFNKPWLEFTGRSLKQELGNGWAEGVHPDDLQRCLKVYTEAFDARKPFVMQYRLRRNDGQFRWVSDEGLPRYDAEGTFAGCIGSAIDVTELVNKDAALKESEERMRLAAEAVSMGIWEWDLNKNEIWATDSRRSLLGWPTLGKVRFEDFISGIHPEDRDRIRQTIDDAIEGGKDYDSEYRLVLPDGVVRWMATRGSVRFDANGKPERVLGISIDITARKQAELEARQRQDDLSHLSRVVLMGEMSASIAHEINQPLGAILSNAEAAELLLESETPPLDEIRKILADIRNDNLRASEIIRHLRLLARKRKMQIESLDVNDVVAEVVRLTEIEAFRRNVLLRTEFTVAPTTIFGDRVHLQQVLINLILNGMEAMAATPEAERCLFIRTATNGERRVEISVTDCGQGIAAEKLPRLFDSFFTTKESGMGLGLAIARSIVDAHQGRIFAENNSDGGATFRFDLPISNEVRSS